MNTDQARHIVEQALREVAPEVDPATLDPEEELRTGVDLDSIDFLNIVEAVATATGHDIPESDYARLVTLRGFVDYVASRG